MKKTFAKKIIEYYNDLNFDGKLPQDISLLNPIKESKDIQKIVATFYKQYFGDSNMRHLILGINPGRLGAGATGIPFTDTKRLKEFCGIDAGHIHTHEPSSVFIYDMINAYGGAKEFYNHFYINSVCPLGFTIDKKGSKEVNYNYYDSKELQNAVEPFIIWNIHKQIEMGCHSDVCFCLGTGKNYKYLASLNEHHHFFEKVVPLDHPRYVMQYKLKSKEVFIDKYLIALRMKNNK
jgi:hypothetical protein